VPDATAGPVLRELVAAIDAGEPVVLATVVGTCHSVPRHAGSKMLIRPGGRHTGSVGGGAVEARVVADALAALAREEPQLTHYALNGGPGSGDAGLGPCGGELTVYLEPHVPPPTVLVVGCGHVGRAVADLAHWLGFRVIAVDSRAEMVTPGLLPDADLRLTGPIEEVLRQTRITAATSIVVTTSSVEADVVALPLLLASPAAYVGVLGSRRRWQATCRELAARGLPGDALGRVRSPVGLDLGAETPREIALAVMGEIVASRRRGAGCDGPP
jgi:xanthine dehydrogenase accessory factor